MYSTDRRRAAGATEFIVLVVLVAIAALAAVESFGWRVEEKTMGADITILEMES